MLSDETSSHKDIIVLRTHELYLFFEEFAFQFYLLSFDVLFP